MKDTKEKIKKEFIEKFTYLDKQGHPRMNNKAPRKVWGYISNLLDALLLEEDEVSMLEEFLYYETIPEEHKDRIRNIQSRLESLIKEVVDE
jgi:hypothetical protein